MAPSHWLQFHHNDFIVLKLINTVKWCNKVDFTPALLKENEVMLLKHYCKLAGSVPVEILCHVKRNFNNIMQRIMSHLNHPHHHTKSSAPLPPNPKVLNSPSQPQGFEPLTPPLSPLPLSSYSSKQEGNNNIMKRFKFNQEVELNSEVKLNNGNNV